MSLIDLASLVLAPTATKEGKVYSAIPDTGEGDMTFTRGSAATRVNSEGLIEKERANLLTYSNDFSQWSAAAHTRTFGYSGYDGTNDAWLVEKTTTTNSYIFSPTISASGVWTYSVYAKANSLGGLVFYTTASGIATFNIEDGLVVNGSNASIESVGNGWYRCSQFGVGIITETRLKVTDKTGTDVQGTIYLQDAQFEQGLIATDVITTTTTAVYEGITDDVPRVDYSGGGCPSLLLEPSRTNLFEHSEYFEGSYWGKTQQGSASVPVVTGNYAISPEGVQNATRVQFDAVGSTSSDRSGLVRDFAFTSGTTYSISCWVKATSGNSELVQFRVAGAQVGGEQTATDEWQLFTATHTATASVTDNFGMQVRGNNTTNESDILIYGMQLEQDVSYSTSYIPTYGTSTTRVADVCSKTGISELIGQTEGVVFLDWYMNHESLNTSEDFYSFTLSDGTSNKIIGVNNYNQSLTVFSKDTTTQFANSSFNGSDGLRIKLALAYKLNDYALYINGSQIATDTNATVPTLDQIRLNAYYNGGGVDSTNWNQIVLFPTRLTNDQLEELTK